MSCTVKAYKLKDVRFDNWDREVRNNWVFDDFFKEPNKHYIEGWVSFDCLLLDQDENLLYCGIASFSNDIFQAFDLKTKKFRSLGFKRIANRYDAKLHRSLEADTDGTIYAATSLLHDCDHQFDAPGGKLVRYDPQTETLKVLAIPVPHTYIQTIALDRTRKIIYGFTICPERFFRYDLRTDESKDLGFIGNSMQWCGAHNPAVDDEGNCWGTYGILRAFADAPGPDSIRLFRYDPDTDRVEWFRHGLPRVAPDDEGRVDCMINGGDGFLYIGSVSGALTRLNPKTTEVELLARPAPTKRLQGLVIGPDGLLYGVCGDQNQVRLFSYDRETAKLTDLGPVYDPQISEHAARCHHICMTRDRVIYVGENDNFTRASYLWECQL